MSIYLKKYSYEQIKFLDLSCGICMKGFCPEAEFFGHANSMDSLEGIHGCHRRCFRKYFKEMSASGGFDEQSLRCLYCRRKFCDITALFSREEYEKLRLRSQPQVADAAALPIDHQHFVTQRLEDFFFAIRENEMFKRIGHTAATIAFVSGLISSPQMLTCMGICSLLFTLPTAGSILFPSRMATLSVTQQLFDFLETHLGVQIDRDQQIGAFEVISKFAMETQIAFASAPFMLGALLQELSGTEFY